MRTLGRGFLLGCGGLLAVAVVIIVIVVAVSASMSGSGNGGAPAPAGESAPARGETLTINVTGTEGIPFTGNYGGIESSRSVDGTVPMTYETEVSPDPADLDVLAAGFQKTGAQGTLTVEVLRGDEVVAEQTTTAEYGVVDVTYTPGQ